MSYNPLSHFYHRKLDHLARLTNLVEGMLVAEAAELDARLASGAERYTEEERQDLYEYHAEDYYELADELPTLLRYSVLAGADSGLEVFLNDIYETSANVHGLTVSFGDLRGAGVERARDYLKKVARMPFADMSVEWIAAKRLHQFRNAIVHADGYVPSDREEIRKWCSSIPGLEITTVGGISLSREFTGAALATYRAFVENVDAACQPLDLWHSVFSPVEGAAL